MQHSSLGKREKPRTIDPAPHQRGSSSLEVVDFGEQCTHRSEHATQGSAAHLLRVGSLTKWRIRRAFSEAQAVGSMHPPQTVRTAYTLKVRFSALLGEEPEVEVMLV